METIFYQQPQFGNRVDLQPECYSRLFSNNAIADFAASKHLIESQFASGVEEEQPEPQQTIQSVFHVIE